MVNQITACVDASVLVALLSPDETDNPLTAFCEKLLSAHTVLWAPALVSFEVLSAVTQKEKKGLISPEDTQKIIETLYQLPIITIWNEALLKKSGELVKSGIASSYDACYLALAFLRNIPLITDDQELMKKGRKFHSPIFSAKAWVETH